MFKKKNLQPSSCFIRIHPHLTYYEILHKTTKRRAIEMQRIIQVCSKGHVSICAIELFTNCFPRFSAQLDLYTSLESSCYWSRFHKSNNSFYSLQNSMLIGQIAACTYSTYLSPHIQPAAVWSLPSVLVYPLFMSSWFVQ